MMQPTFSHDEIIRVLIEIKEIVNHKLKMILDGDESLTVSFKSDQTIVTEIDIFISDLFKQCFFKKDESVLHFFSEEDHHHFKYPMIILDPIDGTRELANNVNECAISFGIYYSERMDDERNFSWIYNPFTGFEINSKETFPRSKRMYNQQLLAFVSRSEFDKNLHISNKRIIYQPKGSIAFKLGLLAAGAGDFVISKKPKNIWDIMAGSHICYTRGINTYQNGNKLQKISEIELQNDLFWGEDELWHKIRQDL